jgi:hypothetical protein
MPDFQTFIAILTALLVFLTGVFLNYDTIQLRNYQFIVPQWAGLLLAGITFAVVVLDQFLRGYGGLSDLRKSNAELSKQNARLAELESKLDIVLQSSDSNLIPTISTDDN